MWEEGITRAKCSSCKIFFLEKRQCGGKGLLAQNVLSAKLYVSFKWAACMEKAVYSAANCFSRQILLFLTRFSVRGKEGHASATCFSQEMLGFLNRFCVRGKERYFFRKMFFLRNIVFEKRQCECGRKGLLAQNVLPPKYCF